VTATEVEAQKRADHRANYADTFYVPPRARWPRSAMNCTTAWATGATDTRFYREVGAQAYGFSLFDDRLKLAEIAALAHGDDERVSIGTLQLTAKAYECLARNFLAGI
jgi:acetylornithine deacetylase/succinyl-diaminopimelate desuccinylase-like protein